MKKKPSEIWDIPSQAYIDAVTRTRETQCPYCIEDMEHKFTIDDATEDFEPTRIYQCKKCKNIEAI